MSIPKAPEHIVSLKRYIAGRSVEEVRKELGLERIIKLASNENSSGSSPKALAAIQESMNKLAQYPDGGLTLRSRLAEFLEVGVENVVAASGSEGVLSAFMRAYLVPGDEVLTAEGTFIGFYVLASAQNLVTKTVALKDYTFDLEAMRAAVTEKTRLVYIANPNNPTGTAVSKAQFEKFMEDLPEHVLVVMDEAYYEYALDWEEYPDSMIYKHDQVITLRTFSKAYGLAGIRIGYGVAHPEIIDNILKVKLPFEPTMLAQAAGIGALEDTEFLAETQRVNNRGIARLYETLDSLNIPYAQSWANFVLLIMESPERAEWLSHQLLLNGIIARPMVPFRLPHTVRITIGVDDEMDVLIEALNTIFK